MAECSAAEDAQQIYSLHINQLVDFFQGDGANNNKDKLSRKKRKREKERRERKESEKERGDQNMIKLLKKPIYICYAYFILDSYFLASCTKIADFYSYKDRGWGGG